MAKMKINGNRSENESNLGMKNNSLAAAAAISNGGENNGAAGTIGEIWRHQRGGVIMKAINGVSNRISQLATRPAKMAG